MKRRSFLAMLGLAPAAAVPAAAQPKRAAVRIPVSRLDPNSVIEFKDGVLRMNVANIGETQTGTFSWYDDGRLVIDAGQFLVRNSPSLPQCTT